MSLTNSYLTTCAYALALRRASLTSALALLFVIAVTKTKCIVLQQPCDYFSILMSSIKPLLVALGPGPKLNGYSITYVIHSLRTSCSELEWV